MRHLFQKRVWGYSVGELSLVAALLAVIVTASSWGLSGVLGDRGDVQLTKTSSTYGEFITDPSEAFAPQP